ncbi:MAG: hypothetical protein WAP35_06145 [Solirubrobacterales bacterium]
MRFKTAILTLTVVASLFALAQPAAASYIKVTTTPSLIDFCRPVPEQLRFAMQFKAKMVRRDSPRPKSVKITYKMIDRATGAVIHSGSLSLTKRNKWTKATPNLVFTAGQALTYDLLSTYRAPRSGKLAKAKAALDDQVPTVEQMDAANAANPAAPPFPACVA